MKTLHFIFDIDGTLTAADTNLAWVAHEGGNPAAFHENQHGMKNGEIRTKGQSESSRWDMEMAMAHLLKHMPERPDLWANPNQPVTMTRQGMENMAQSFTRFHPGVVSESGQKNFFDNVRDYVKTNYGEDIQVEFHGLSGGHSVLARNLAIAKNFKAISASEPHFDENGHFVQMASVIKEHDKRGHVLKMSKEQNIPLSDMIYLGDGLNDKHAMEAIVAGGGQAIGIEGHHTELLRKSDITCVLPPDYTSQGPIFETVTRMVDGYAASMLEADKDAFTHTLEQPKATVALQYNTTAAPQKSVIYEVSFPKDRSNGFSQAAATHYHTGWKISSTTQQFK